MRRLRRTPLIRELVREVAVSKSDLIQPLFVEEGLSRNVPISSMPGQPDSHSHHSRKKQLTSKIEGSDQSSCSVFRNTKTIMGPMHTTPKELCKSRLRA